VVAVSLREVSHLVCRPIIMHHVGFFVVLVWEVVSLAWFERGLGSAYWSRVESPLFEFTLYLVRF